MTAPPQQMPQSLTSGANDEPGRHGMKDRGGSKAGHRVAATTSRFFQMKIVLVLTIWGTCSKAAQQKYPVE